MEVRDGLFNIAAIVSEYNPFHNGHRYHIDRTRELGVTHIVAIMGGNFSQRGTPSIASKWARTQMALENGVDLVLELPTLWTVASAERFSFGAITIANALGCIDCLSFGSENGNESNLRLAAEATMSPAVQKAALEYLKKGARYAAAIELAVKDVVGSEISDILSSPNNVLAIEYIKSLIKLNSNITPITIKREGIGHNSNIVYNNIASASYIRNEINNNRDVMDIVPKSVWNILKTEIELGFAPVFIENAEKAILSKLRTMSIEELSNLPDVSEGLENRLYSAIRASTSLSDLYRAVETKRYTSARIRRLVLAAFLGINAMDAELPMPYIRVLGFNSKGREILKLAKRTAKLPVVTRLSQVMGLEDSARRVFDIECVSTDLYALCSRKSRVCGLEMTQNQIIL